MITVILIYIYDRHGLSCFIEQKRDSHSNSLFDMRIKVACNKLKYGGCYKRTKCTCSRSADEFLPRSLKCSLQPAALYRKGPHADFHATDCAHVCTDKSNIVSILICNCKRWLGFQVQQLGLHWVYVYNRNGYYTSATSMIKHYTALYVWYMWTLMFH